MKQAGTLVIQAALMGQLRTCRDIEIEASQSLYRLAEAIVAAFGFYSGFTPATLMRAHPKYELFADMGDAEPGVAGVKNTEVAKAFAAIGHTMVFLFDYGDGWHFRVRLKETGTKAAKARYPRVVATRGDAPAQYPDPDDVDEDAPTRGINPVTGEKLNLSGRSGK